MASPAGAEWDSNATRMSVLPWTCGTGGEVSVGEHRNSGRPDRQSRFGAGLHFGTNGVRSMAKRVLDATKICRIALDERQEYLHPKTIRSPADDTSKPKSIDSPTASRPPGPTRFDG